jgi:hypothetical protein
MELGEPIERFMHGGKPHSPNTTIPRHPLIVYNKTTNELRYTGRHIGILIEEIRRKRIKWT